jgi:Tfp pilus assembly protein PilF
MAKPMLVTLPVVMLLMDYWPFHRIPPGPDSGGIREILRRASLLWDLVKEKIPFLVLSALSAAVTIYAQRMGGAINVFDRIPLELRIGNSTVACVKYVQKMFWPHDLAMLYPFPKSIPLWQFSGAFLLMAVTTLAVIRFRRRHAYLITGWFWFLVTLVPVIGIIQVGGQSMADRYTYIPLTGLFIMCAWGGADILHGWRYRKAILATLAGLVIAVSAISTWGQVGYWRDDIILYRHTLEVTTGNSTIWSNYAGALAERGEPVAAIREYREVLRIWPNSPREHNNMGYLLAAQGNFAEAIYHHNEVLRLTSDASPSHGNPGRMFDRATAHLNLGNVYLAQGKVQEAEQEYKATLELSPENDKAHNNLGITYATNGKFTEAITEFNRALQLNPYNVDAKKNLAISIRKAAALGNK